MPREVVRCRQTNTPAKKKGRPGESPGQTALWKCNAVHQKNETAGRIFAPHTSRLRRRSSTLGRPHPQFRHGPTTYAHMVPRTNPIIYNNWHPPQTVRHAATVVVLPRLPQSQDPVELLCEASTGLQATAPITARTESRATMPRNAGHPGPLARDRGSKRPAKTLNTARAGKYEVCSRRAVSIPNPEHISSGALGLAIASPQMPGTRRHSRAQDEQAITTPAYMNFKAAATPGNSTCTRL